MNKNIMPKDDNTLMTPEGFALKFQERETVELKLDVPKDVFEILEKLAAERDLPLIAVVKFYIGQGLRQDLGTETMAKIVKRRLQANKQSFETLSEAEVDQAA